MGAWLKRESGTLPEAAEDVAGGLMDNGPIQGLRKYGIQGKGHHRTLEMEKQETYGLTVKRGHMGISEKVPPLTVNRARPCFNFGKD